MFEPKTPPILTDEVERAWVGLMSGQRRVFEAIERDLKAAGLPPLNWYDVMLELDRSHGGRLRPFDIEKRTLFAQPNLSRLIDRLERDGLIERKAFDGDRRGQWVQITMAGRAKRAEMWNVYGAAIQRHLGARLGNERAGQLADLLAPFSAARESTATD